LKNLSASFPLVIEELVSIFSFGHWRTCQHLFLWSLKNLSVSFPLVIEELVSIFSFGHWRICQHHLTSSSMTKGKDTDKFFNDQRKRCWQVLQWPKEKVLTISVGSWRILMFFCRLQK
jgi:hypothetical protein